MIILIAIVYFIGILASDCLTNLCSHCSTVWVMIVCEEIFVHLQTIWLGCVGVCSPLQDCSVSVWAEYTPVIFLVSVCLQIWGRLVITFWVKIDRDVGEFFNLKLHFWKRDYFYNIFLH